MKKVLTKVLKIAHPNGKSSSLHENSLLKSQTAKLIRAQSSQKEVLQIKAHKSSDQPEGSLANNFSLDIFSKISCLANSHELQAELFYFGIFYALRFQIDKTEN